MERTAEIEATSGERAAVAAVQEKLVPAEFHRGEPIYWSASMAGEDRWITVVDPSTLAWGDDIETATAVFLAELLSEDSE